VVSWVAQNQLGWRHSTLLYNVSQLVCQELLAKGIVRPISLVIEKDVSPSRESVCAERAAKTSSLGVGMHADSAEIGGEGPLKPMPGFIPQGLPAAALPLNCRLKGKCNFVSIRLGIRWRDLSRSIRVIIGGGINRDVAEVPGWSVAG
jgi:hypothetical protein